MVSSRSWAEAGTSRATSSTIPMRGRRSRGWVRMASVVLNTAAHVTRCSSPPGGRFRCRRRWHHSSRFRTRFSRPIRRYSPSTRCRWTRGLSTPTCRTRLEARKVALRTLYRVEDLFVYLFLPASAAAPFQPVVYFPGASAQQPAIARGTPDADGRLCRPERACGHIPIYAGTHERQQGVIPRADTRDGVDYVARLNGDLRRALDYLETRDDIQFKTPAYYGFSWERTRPHCSWRWSRDGVPRCCSTAGLTRADAARNPPVGLCAARPDSRAHDQRVLRCVLSGSKRARNRCSRCWGRLPRTSGVSCTHGHSVFTGYRNQAIRNILDWLDRYQGPVQ